MASTTELKALEQALDAAEKAAYVAQQALFAAHSAVIGERLRAAFPDHTTAVFSRTDDEDYAVLHLVLNDPDGTDDEARRELDFRENREQLEEALSDDAARAVDKINDALIVFGTSHENLEEHFAYAADDEGEYYKFVLEFRKAPGTEAAS